MSSIGINEVLLHLKEGKQCSLVYIRGQGKYQGRSKTIDNAIEGWNYSSFNTKKSIDHIRLRNKKTIGKQKTKGLIPIIDLDNGRQQLTLFISHIVKYNGMKIIH